MFNGPTIGFCLHNPSSANASKDDPTLRRGVAFAKSWGASRLVFVNPWAAVATRPRDLWANADPVGPENDAVIAEAASEIAASSGFVILAWGAVKPPSCLKAAVRQRLSLVADIFHEKGCPLKTLGFNQDGSPKHPLYVKHLTSPTSWQIET